MESAPAIESKSPGMTYPQEIKNLIAGKRKLGKNWQQKRYPVHKTQLNKISEVFRTKLKETKNLSINRYLRELTNDKSTN